MYYHILITHNANLGKILAFTVTVPKSFLLSPSGIGTGMFVTASVVLIYNFDSRLSRANGVSSAGTAVSLFVLPPLVQFLINQYGLNGALLITAGLAAHGATFGALYRPSPLELEIRNKTKRRQSTDNLHNISTDKNTQNHSGAKKHKGVRFFSVLKAFINSIDLPLLINVPFMSLFISYVLQGGGYIIMITFLPPHAVNIGISKFLSAFLVSMIGITSVTTRLTYGYILDYNLISATTLAAIAAIVDALCCMMNPIWYNYGYLATLSAIFGVSSAISNSIIPIIAQEYVEKERASGAVSYLLAAWGLGAVLASFTSGNHGGQHG